MSSFPSVVPGAGCHRSCGLDIRARGSSTTGDSIQFSLTHPQYPVEIFLIHTQEVAVVLSQYNGGSTRRICNQGQLPKVIPFVERTHHALRRTHHTWIQTSPDMLRDTHSDSAVVIVSSDALQNSMRCWRSDESDESFVLACVYGQRMDSLEYVECICL